MPCTAAIRAARCVELSFEADRLWELWSTAGVRSRRLIPKRFTTWPSLLQLAARDRAPHVESTWSGDWVMEMEDRIVAAHLCAML